jgi:uncharacterized cupin superfamily protein
VEPAYSFGMSPEVALRIHEQDELVASPIPADWVLAGQPVARVKHLASNLGRTRLALWDCTAGQFRWRFGPCDEAVHVLEGSVRVVDSSGEERVLQAGDAALFKAGTTSVWTVDAYVKKLAVIHDRRWLPRRAVAHVLGRARAKL